MEGQLTKFVKLVSEHPCLYNHTMPEKIVKEDQEAAWSQIAAEMEWTETKCKDKWRTVRNGYVRSLKLATESMGARQRRPYYLAEELQFVAPYVKQHGATVSEDGCSENDVPSSHDDSDNEEIQAPKGGKSKRVPTEFVSTATPPKKVKREKEVHIEVRPDTNDTGIDGNWLDKTDPMDPSSSDYRKMFLLSLLSDIHMLSDSNMLTFRIKVLELIQQLFQCQGIVE